MNSSDSNFHPPFRIDVMPHEFEEIYKEQYRVLLNKIGINPDQYSQQEARELLAVSHPSLLSLLEDLKSKYKAYYELRELDIQDERRVKAQQQAQDALMTIEKAVAEYWEKENKQ